MIDSQLADAVRRYVADGTTARVTRPRRAATVVLTRDGERGLEVLLLERPASMRFAASQTVFPGGVVDPTDVKDAELLGMSAAQVAAVREVLEEAGILLADPPGAISRADLDAWRGRLLDGECGLADIVSDAGCSVRAPLPWARWVTPPWSGRRYDTHFFLAPVPAGQVAVGDPRESRSLVWRSVQGALVDAAEGRRSMMTPTLRTLEEIAPCRTVAEALEGQQHRPPDPEPTTFSAVRDGDRIKVYLEAPYSRTEAWSVSTVPVADRCAGTPPTRDQVRGRSARSDEQGPEAACRRSDLRQPRVPGRRPSESDDKRWPRWVYGSGKEPDYRFSYANERTYLAWIRTSLAFLAAGVALDVVDLSISDTAQRALAVLLVSLGLMSAVAAWIRWALAERAVRARKPLPSFGFVALITVAMVVAAIVLRCLGL